MVLYHGSDKKIIKPCFHGGRPHNDYGHGFYCTEHPPLAREWAVGDDHDGYLNSYELDLEGLTVLDLNTQPILSWLVVLLENRTFAVETGLARTARDYIISEFKPDYNSYDIIRGYRADDSYFSFAQDFISNSISFEQLKEAMYLGDLGEQIVLKSERAYELIKYSGSEKVLRDPWLERKKERDSKARKKYFSMDRMNYRPGEIYVVKIMDEEMKRDDPRLR